MSAPAPHGNAEMVAVVISSILQPLTGWLSLWLYGRLRRYPTLAPAWTRPTLYAALSGLFLPTPLCIGFYVWVDLRSLAPRWLQPLRGRLSPFRRALAVGNDLFLAILAMLASVLITWVPLVLLFTILGLE